MKSMGAQFSKELQWHNLMMGHQNGGSSNCHQADMSFYVSDDPPVIDSFSSSVVCLSSSVQIAYEWVIQPVYRMK